MKTFKILQADFSVWSHVMYLEMAVAIVERLAHERVLYIVQV